MLKVEKKIETVIDLESDINGASPLNTAPDDMHTTVNQDTSVPCQNMNNNIIQTEFILPQSPSIHN